MSRRGARTVVALTDQQRHHVEEVVSVVYYSALPTGQHVYSEEAVQQTTEAILGTLVDRVGKRRILTTVAGWVQDDD